MKKVLKSSSLNVLTIYEKKYPNNLWNDFYRYNNSRLYKRLKKKIFDEQGGICAYCESEILDTYKQRIEHFNDKSNSTLINNLHLKWNNVFGVCLGGQNKKGSDEYKRYPSPANLSCDAYKAHKKIAHTNILNPLKLQAFPNLFKLDKRTCELEANIENCESIDILDNPYKTTEEFVTQTIINLNLNCDRLTTDRHKILIAYSREIAEGRRVQDRAVFENLAKKWFSKKHPSFFTTRRILLGIHAEKFLNMNNYNG